MAGFKSLPLQVFIFVLVMALSPTVIGADLQTYIKKHQSTTISQDALMRVQRYEHLINYFTRFYYFRPNHRVSADFIKALILAESAAHPDAVSAKNAIGLGQIIFTTGQEAAKELADSQTHFRYVSKRKLQNLEQADLFDPATNILLTCYLIAKYNHRFNGRIDLVLSAWNAGENTDSLSNGKPAPYTETRELIGRVNGYYLYLLKKKGALRH